MLFSDYGDHGDDADFIISPLPPSIPFWLGEAPGRTEELSRQIGELRQTISDLTPHTVPGFVNQKSPEVLNAVEWLKSECGLDDSGAEQAIEYIVTGRTSIPLRFKILFSRSAFIRVNPR